MPRKFEREARKAWIKVLNDKYGTVAEDSISYEDLAKLVSMFTNQVIEVDGKDRVAKALYLSSIRLNDKIIRFLDA